MISGDNEVTNTCGLAPFQLQERVVMDSVFMAS